MFSYNAIMDPMGARHQCSSVMPTPMLHGNSCVLSTMTKTRRVLCAISARVDWWNVMQDCQVNYSFIHSRTVD